MAQFLPLLELALRRVEPPVAWILGAPRLIVQLASRLVIPSTTAYQMDLYQADRLRAESEAADLDIKVEAAPDLWDLPQRFRTVVFPAPPRAERELKIDMVEQAYHIVEPGGLLVVLSPHRGDDLFPRLVKKVFGKSTVMDSPKGTVIVGERPEEPSRERPRRRHEMMVHARIDAGEPLRFVTRPGVFTYGRLDSGSRALLVAARIDPGDRVLDLGCGAGAVGLAAARRLGQTGEVTFVDSNLRAVALAELNAKRVGLSDYRVVAASRLEGVPLSYYDVVLTNPPYFAVDSITQLFVERSAELLKLGGRFYLVTKQWSNVEPIFRRVYDDVEAFENRGYFIFAGRTSGKPRNGRTADPLGEA